MSMQRTFVRAILVALLSAVLVGCGANMEDTGRVKPYEENVFFEDGRSARPLPDNTVARGFEREDDHFYTGLVDGELATTFPVEVDQAMIERGRERYNIYCSPCHAQTGAGDGIIVQRGFPAPPSFLSQRLIDAPVGHYFDAITNGFGRMFSYASRVNPSDRWAIIAYIRALQLSQNATQSDVPAGETIQEQESQP